MGGLASVEAQNIVERHGQLKVSGNKVKDECDRNVQLRGMSYFWHQWEGSEYWNNNVVKWMRDDWKVTVLRAAMGVRDGGQNDYLANPTNAKNKVITVVDAAIQHGIYVIIDWHAHPNKKAEAKAFFAEMAQKYKGKPNVIYEIWNEPIGSFGTSAAQNMWDNELKQYAREVIASIRDHDTENLIVMGTPFYCQYPNVVVNNKITTDSKGRNVKNIAYTIHAYAGAHGQTVRNQAQAALDGGLALFMTECGRVGTNYGPNNNINTAEWNLWESWMDDNKISWCKWSMSDKNEVSSSLQPSAPVNGNWNATNHLTAEGRWSRNKLRAKNATLPSVCTPGGGGSDEITSITAPGSVSRGQTVNVVVNYSATTNRDIRVVFQRDNSPFTTYVQKKVDVGSGSGTTTVSLTIPNNVPVVNNDYQFQVYLTTNNGGWPQRLSNKVRRNVNVTNSSTSTSSTNVYTDNLNDGWTNWSWGGNATVRDGGVKRFGSYSFKYQYNNGGAASFRHPVGRSTNDLIRLEFWARVWTGSTTFQVSASYNDDYSNRSSPKNRTVTTTWQKFTLTKAQMDNYGWIKRIFFFNGNTNNTIFLDNVKLIYSSSSHGTEEYVELGAADLGGVTTAPLADIYPNPNNGTFTVDLTLPNGLEQLNLDLLDVNGRLIDHQEQTATEGFNRYGLEYQQQIKPGLYFLRMTDGEGSVRLIKRVMIR